MVSHDNATQSTHLDVSFNVDVVWPVSDQEVHPLEGNLRGLRLVALHSHRHRY